MNTVANTGKSVVNTALKAGADTLVSLAQVQARQTATVSFVANAGASSDATSVASRLPVQKVVQVPSNSLTGLLVDNVLHSAVTLAGTVVTTKDITQPSQPGGYNPGLALHEETHVVQQQADPLFYCNYFFMGGNNYGNPSSYECQANSFADQYVGQITPVSPPPVYFNPRIYGIY